jgi:hypothetical protein
MLAHFARSSFVDSIEPWTVANQLAVSWLAFISIMMPRIGCIIFISRIDSRYMYTDVVTSERKLKIAPFKRNRSCTIQYRTLSTSLRSDSLALCTLVLKVGSANFLRIIIRRTDGDAVMLA